MHRTRLGVVIALATLVALSGAPQAHAGRGGSEPGPPVAVPLARAGTSVTIGATSTDTTTGDCAADATHLQSTSSPPLTYGAPAGVITSFSYNANAVPGQVRLALFVPGSVAGHWTLMAKSDLKSVVPNVVNTFPVRVPVQAGWILGLFTSADAMNCYGPGVPGGDTVLGAIFDPGTSTDFVTLDTEDGVRANVAAVVESDADGDGFGDVTQDACPAAAATQAVCPAPETKIRAKPAKRTTERRIVVRFRSSIAGSTFLCSLDGKPFKKCSSPYRKRLGVGRHKLVIQAVSPMGVADGSPAKVRFRIVPADD